MASSESANILISQLEHYACSSRFQSIWQPCSPWAIFHNISSEFGQITYCNIVRTDRNLTVMPKGDNAESLCFSIRVHIYAQYGNSSKPACSSIHLGSSGVVVWGSFYSMVHLFVSLNILICFWIVCHLSMDFLIQLCGSASTFSSYLWTLVGISSFWTLCYWSCLPSLQLILCLMVCLFHPLFIWLLSFSVIVIILHVSLCARCWTFAVP